jgi:prevent-host-death family protein
MQYSISDARTHLSRLIREAEAGEEVIILRGARPAFKIIPLIAPDNEMASSLESLPADPNGSNPSSS